MTPRTVLIVDDSVVMRRFVQEALRGVPELRVESAADGQLALDHIAQSQPDAIVLDVEMPNVDGLGVLRELNARGVSIPVIMFSTLTERGAQITLDALALGAVDYVPKPTGTGSLQESLKVARRELVPRLRALLGIDTPAPPSSPASRPRFVPTPRPSPRVARAPLVRPSPTAALRTSSRPPVASSPRSTDGARIDLIAVGVSTGGPQALDVFVGGLPSDLAVPIVIVQHMPAQFTAALAKRLNSKTSLRVAEAYEGAVAAPGTIWIAKGDFHTEIGRDGGNLVLRQHQGERVNFCRPAVDVLFQSVARQLPGQALGLVLTGMGRDGTEGAIAMSKSGCPIVAQDAATCVVYGMPRAVAEAGVVSEVLPLPAIAGRVSTLAARSAALQPA